MLKLVGTDAAAHKVEFTLLNDDNKPTLLFVGLVAAELALDAFIAYSLFRLFKGLSR